MGSVAVKLAFLLILELHVTALGEWQHIMFHLDVSVHCAFILYFCE